MVTKNLADYYPVYKDLSDRMNANLSDPKQHDPKCKPDHSPAFHTSETVSPGLPEMLNAEELTDLALKCGFSKFQIVILLFKNAFEGHVFLTWKIRPEQLFSQGTLLFQTKPGMMILSFYKDFEHYKPGLCQIWKVLQEKVSGLGGISFDLMIHTIIVNHLLRFPVSLLSLYDVRSFSESLPINQQAMDQKFELVLSGESALGETEFVQRVNLTYAEKYKEFVHQLGIKEGVFSHYQRKLALALYPDIHTEEELDDLMYKKIIEDQLGRTTHDIITNDIATSLTDDQVNSDASKFIQKLAKKTKNLYRSVSKNCSEIHSATDSENSYPELNNIFLKANSIYNEPVSNLSDAILQNMRMLLLLSEVVIFRTTRGYALTGNLQLITDFNGKEVLPEEDIKVLRKNLDITAVSNRIKSFTDYKIKFVMDDDFTDIHNLFLQKQLDFIDQQIIQIQKDIKEIFKLKLRVSDSKTNKN
jgi:hypothetical protein